MKRKYTAFTKAFKQQTLDLASQLMLAILWPMGRLGIGMMAVVFIR
jgi:hypothetical protein